MQLRRTGPLAALTLVALIAAAKPGFPWPQDGPQLPDAAHVVAAYSKARAWVNAFDLPLVEAEESRVQLTGTTALLVMVRSAGRVAGVGMDWTADDRMLRRAVGRALSDLRGDPAVGRMPIEVRDQIGERVTLEIEAAGALTPLIANTWGDVARQVRPGLDGVALRRGDAWVFRFPAHLRAFNNAGQVAAVLPGLLPDLEITAADRDLAQLRLEEGLSVYRFSTIHLAQQSPDAQPFTTFRGSAIIAASEVTARSLSEFCEGLVAHLLAHRWERRGPDGEVIGDEPLGMFGSYEPVTGRFDPLVAPPFEQALVSYALSHCARTPGISEQSAQSAAAFAEEILLELADLVPDSESDPNDDPAASAMIILAADALIQNPSASIRELASQARARLWKAFDPQAGGFVAVATPNGQIVSLPAQSRAMIACAMARLLVRGENVPGGRPAVRTALDSAWLSADAVEQVGLLPWIGWGELDYATVAGSSPEEVAARLETLRTMLWASQVGVSSSQEPDLIGGFALAGAWGTQVTSQGVRPAAWLARRAAAGGGGQADRGAEVGRLLLFGRFLLQIAVAEDGVWFYQNARLAQGGVREAVWDSSLLLPAQALALLTASDILRAVDGLAGP